jgi:hypothetical protein
MFRAWIYSRWVTDKIPAPSGELRLLEGRVVVRLMNKVGRWEAIYSYELIEQLATGKIDNEMLALFLNNVLYHSTRNSPSYTSESYY